MALNLPFLTKNNTDTSTKKPIQEFVAQVKTGAMARTNRYTVFFEPPIMLTNNDKRKTMLFCDQVQIPGANFSTVQNRTFGEFRETPYEKIYDNITMSFYVDNDMKVKQLFDDWQNIIANPVTRVYNYYNKYICDMAIEVQDINDNTRYQINLFECYPKGVSSIQLDYASKDVMKIQVNMQYKYWIATPVTTLADGNKVPLSLMDKFTKNFTGFQQTLNETLGASAGNFLTGAVGAWGVSKLPGLLKF